MTTVSGSVFMGPFPFVANAQPALTSWTLRPETSGSRDANLGCTFSELTDKDSRRIILPRYDEGVPGL